MCIRDRFMDKWYPTIAGRAIILQQEGEENAAKIWSAMAKDAYALRAEPSQSAPEPKPEVCKHKQLNWAGGKSVKTCISCGLEFYHCSDCSQIHEQDCWHTLPLCGAEPSQSGEREEAFRKAANTFYAKRQKDGNVYSAGSFEAGWLAAEAYLQAAKDHAKK